MAYQPQGPVYNPPQQQIVTVSSGNPNIQAHYNSIGSRRTGWIQLVCGSICVLLGIVAIFIRCYMSGGYFPIWSGLLFFITPGIAGICAAKSRTSCAITTFMVLSIFASVFSFCLVWVMLSSAVEDASPRNCKIITDCTSSVNFSECSPSSNCTHYKGYEACVAIDVILLFTALTEFIVSIISAAICCRGVCCKGSSKQSASYTTVSQQVPPPGTVVMQAPAAAYTVQPSAPAPYPAQGYPPAGYPPPSDAAYPPQASYGEKPPLGYTQSTAPSAPAMDHPPTYEQSVTS